MRGSTTGVSNEEILRASHDYALRGRLRGRRPSCRGCGGRLTLERVRNDQSVCGPCSEEVGGIEAYKNRMREYRGHGRKDVEAGRELGEFRNSIRVPVEDISREFDIPVNTLRDWLCGRSRMPSSAYDDILQYLKDRHDSQESAA